MKFEEQFSMQQEVVVVTGASGGLGSELAKILAAAKAHVVLVDINRDGIESIRQELSQKGCSVMPVVTDVTDSRQTKAMLEQVDQTFHRLDVLVNCAGILGVNKLMFEVPESDWDSVMDINLKATWQLSTLVAKYMSERQIKGRIVNISSSLGGRAQLKRIHYATSKAAVEHLTRNMAMELIPHQIRVNCLAPGWVNTPMVQEILDGPEGPEWRKTIPMGRAADPHELTGALLLLASRASSYMTGSVLRVDGGYAYRGIESDL